MSIFDQICNSFAENHPFNKKIVDMIQDENLTVLLFGAAVESASSSRRNLIFNPIPPMFVRMATGLPADTIIAEYIELLCDTGCRRSMDKFNTLVSEDAKNYKLLDKILNHLSSLGGVATYVKFVRCKYDSFIECNSPESAAQLDKTINDNSLCDHIMAASTKDQYAKLLFDFMRFSLMNNKLTLQRNDIVIGDPTVIKSTDSDVCIDKKHVYTFHQYEVVHTKETELEFLEKTKINDKKLPVSCFLFHGSKRENWYSLMCNGIKVASGTPLMTTGAAYGKGVYASDALSVSYSYSSTYGTPLPQITKKPSASALKENLVVYENLIANEKLAENSLSNNQIIAIYEIVGEKAVYMKATGYYVIPDDSLLIIRYLIAIPANLSQIVTEKTVSDNILNSAFTRGCVMRETLRRTMVGWRRRIKNDLKTAMKNPQLTIYVNATGANGDLEQYNPRKRNAGKILKSAASAPHKVEFTFKYDCGGTIAPDATAPDEFWMKTTFPLNYPSSPPICIINGRSVYSDWTLKTKLDEYVCGIALANL